MRSKASLFLMEQLVMILVFALAAALCLRLFVHTQEISLETAHRDKAVVIAQNGAELVKAGLHADEIEKNLSCAPFAVRIQMLPSEFPGLAQAEVVVLYEEEKQFSLTVGYQEVDQ